MSDDDDDIILINEVKKSKDIDRDLNKTTTFTVISDIDDDDANSDFNTTNLNSNKNNYDKNNNNIYDDDDDILQIFGVGKTRKICEQNNSKQCTSHINNENILENNKNSDKYKHNDNDNDIDDIILISDNSIIQGKSSKTNLTLDSELIYINDDANINNDINKESDYNNSYRKDDELLNSSINPINTSSHNIDNFPLSSPNINRSIDLIDIDNMEVSNISDSIEINTSITFPLLYQKSKKRKISAAKERANIYTSIPSPLDISSSSITSISLPKNKVRRIDDFELDSKKRSNENNKYKYREKLTRNNNDSLDKTNKSPLASKRIIKPIKQDSNSSFEIENLSKRSRNKNNVSNMINKNKRISSDISEYSSSFNDINNERSLSNNEIKERENNLKKLKKKEVDRVKSLVSDLANLRNQRNDNKNKFAKTANEVLNIAKVTSKIDTSSDSISNSSSILNINQKVNHNFMDIVTDDINLYTEERLDYMLERSKQFESEKLKKVNQSKYTKEQLIERITCCFSSCLDAKLKSINKEYSSHLSPAKFETFDEILPIIRFKRYVDSVLHEKKNTFVPIKPRELFEEFLIILYDANELIELLNDGIMRRHLNSIKLKYPKYRIAVWITEYDQFLQKLKTKANKAYKEKVQEKLDLSFTETQSKSKSNNNKAQEQNLNNLIQPKHIKQKLLRYEIEYDFSFQSFKGLKDLFEWLLSIVYTLSSKYIDLNERNNGISTIGKIKNGDNAESCLVQMLTQVKGFTEGRAKKFVQSKSYKCVGNLFDDIFNGNDISAGQYIRTDHEKLLNKIFNARNENDIL